MKQEISFEDGDLAYIAGQVQNALVAIERLRTALTNLRTFWTVKLFNVTVLTVEGSVYEHKSIPEKQEG